MDFNNKAESSVTQASSLWGFVEAGSTFAATKTHRLEACVTRFKYGMTTKWSFSAALQSVGVHQISIPRNSEAPRVIAVRLRNPTE